MGDCVQIKLYLQNKQGAEFDFKDIGCQSLRIWHTALIKFIELKTHSFSRLLVHLLLFYGTKLRVSPQSIILVHDHFLETQENLTKTC
jgi:hypothetical protein